MTILFRMARLLRADIHALLDRFEAPDLILSQALREMEQSLDRGRQELARLERESRWFAEREAELQRQVRDEEGALADCLGADQDDLARSVIRRRLERERQAESVRRGAARIAETREELEREIAARSGRLAELRAQAALHEETRAEDPVSPRAFDLDAVSVVRDADVEVALLRAKRARESRS
ncbi:PspA/IM30 family protein [Thiorhodococcus fuscus]|uniref:PspA/IM30 family protein n=1 Tax=Thiorhodococcus fuscus TaxID=527200 RepID=A0ABW4Y7W8_9GAMM